ncbi:DUF1738 domain-containing protein [Pseudomonas sp. JG-B]|nr:DUF1738 domain-containing protein [Pseudomonas sp. JG-B]
MTQVQATARKASRKSNRPQLTREEIQQDALKNAIGQNSVANYQAIFEGFEAKGIPAEDILPRENIFTYNAWLALGRQVKKGERGVQIVTMVTGRGKRKEGEDGQEGEGAPYKFARTVTVFHISQTVAADEAKATETVH